MMNADSAIAPTSIDPTAIDPAGILPSALARTLGSAYGAVELRFEQHIRCAPSAEVLGIDTATARECYRIHLTLLRFALQHPGIAAAARADDSGDPTSLQFRLISPLLGRKLRETEDELERAMAAHSGSRSQARPRRLQADVKRAGQLVAAHIALARVAARTGHPDSGPPNFACYTPGKLDPFIALALDPVYLGQLDAWMELPAASDNGSQPHRLKARPPQQDPLTSRPGEPAPPSALDPNPAGADSSAVASALDELDRCRTASLARLGDQPAPDPARRPAAAVSSEDLMRQLLDLSARLDDGSPDSTGAELPSTPADRTGHRRAALPGPHPEDRPRRRSLPAHPTPFRPPVSPAPSPRPFSAPSLSSAPSSASARPLTNMSPKSLPG